MGEISRVWILDAEEAMEVQSTLQLLFVTFNCFPRLTSGVRREWNFWRHNRSSAARPQSLLSKLSGNWMNSSPPQTTADWGPHVNLRLCLKTSSPQRQRDWYNR